MRALLRAVVGLAVITWWVVPGMGTADLGVSWDEDWPVVLESGWGLLCTIGLGLPFLVAAIFPRHARACLAQVTVIAATLLVAALGGLEPEMWWFFVLFAVELPALFLLARGTAPARRAPALWLILLAAVGAPGWLPYAWSILAANRAVHFDGDITMQVDHYPVQAALAMTLIALPAVAGCGAPGRRLLGTSTALMAGYLGFVTYNWVDMQADLNGAWSLAAMAWAVAVLTASWWPTRRGQLRLPSQDGPPL